ncbi:MAG: nucleotide exchange factor GrpE [Chloroflexota bacterium]|nr:nucleotide exchange factor GrpE [Chloroflexota bacterium]
MRRSDYDDYLRRQRAQGEPTRTLTASQLKQIENAFEEVKQQAKQWETAAREWETAAKKAQERASDYEEKTNYCKQLVEQARQQSADWEARARELRAAVVEAREQPEEKDQEIDDLKTEMLTAEESIETLQSDAQASDTRIAELQEELLHQEAEYRNSRRRLERLFANQTEQDKRSMLLEMLPVLDNLQRALDFTPGQQPDADTLREGVELTRRTFVNVLEKNGIQAIDAVGQPFDPTIHEAIGLLPAPGLAPDTVAAVEQQGYRYGDDILRPARVLVTPG